MAKSDFRKLDISVLIVGIKNKEQKRLVSILNRKVKRTLIADNGKTAIETCRQYRPAVVCTGLILPDMNGIKLTEHIKKINGNTEVILIVSRGMDRLLQGAFPRSVHAGVDHYILKPVEEKAFFRIIERIYENANQEKLSKMQYDLIRKLSLTVAQSPSSIVITDIHRNIEYINPRFEEVTGYKRDDVIGKNASLLKSGKTAVQTYKKLANDLATGKAWRGEFINKKKNGELYWEMATISPIRNENGETSHYVFIGEDITQKKRAEEALQLSEKNLRKRNEMIEQDLRNAQMIQRALLPREIPDIREIKIDYRYLPLESVGGDYFSLTNLREGGLGVFLGDVTGHGVSAALFLAMVKAFTDRACRQHGREPKQYFTMLNGDLLDNMTTNFLTAVYGVFKIDREQHKVTFTFAKGGHPPPIVHRVSNGQAEIHDVNGTILGMMPGADYEQKTIELGTGDKLFLYTDGVHETMNIKNQFFGLEGLCGAIKKADKDDLSETLDGIVRNIQSYRGKAPIRDDIVILGFQIKL